MVANDRQVGGAHYKTSYEHWDLCLKIPLGYLEGCTTKHVTRWRKKLGLQDLQKGLHYLDKLIEAMVFYRPPPRNTTVDIPHELDLFMEANCLTYLEREYTFLLCTFKSRHDLLEARHVLVKIIEQGVRENTPKEEPNHPGTPDDGGHHAH